MDYLRQLANDEKRSRFATVATVIGRDIVGPLTGTLAVSTIPGQSVAGKIYAVVTEAFEAGSTLDWGFTGGATDTLIAGLDLATVGATIGLPVEGGVYIIDAVTGITPNAAAIASNIGEVKLVIEFTQSEVKCGLYSA